MKILKREMFDSYIEDLSHCKKCTNLKKKNGQDCSLINIYQDQELCKNIPSIWTDWYNHLDASIMIIGQDWGPFKDMQQLNNLYKANRCSDNWYKLMESEKSLTKKNLTNFLIESSEGRLKSLDNIYITNAIMCARCGDYYRDNNIKLKECTLNCSEYLKKQIDIVKPQVILTLGYYPLLSLSNIYNFSLPKTLSEVIDNMPIIKVDKYIIIPLYHPSAQISKDKQLVQYKKIWAYIK